MSKAAFLPPARTLVIGATLSLLGTVPTAQGDNDENVAVLVEESATLICDDEDATACSTCSTTAGVFTTRISPTGMEMVLAMPVFNNKAPCEQTFNR